MPTRRGNRTKTRTTNQEETVEQRNTKMHNTISAKQMGKITPCKPRASKKKQKAKRAKQQAQRWHAERGHACAFFLGSLGLHRGHHSSPARRHKRISSGHAPFSRCSLRDCLYSWRQLRPAQPAGSERPDAGAPLRSDERGGAAYPLSML